MPRQVDQVPNPWEPYMDGNLWEFTEDEYRAMPGWQPMTNTIGLVCGRTRMQWYQGGRYYVRFFDAERGADVDVLAGWKADSDLHRALTRENGL